MRRPRTFTYAALLVACGALTASAETPRTTPTTPATASSTTSSSNPMMSVDATLKDITATIGFVPQFIRSAPPALLPQVWASLKGFQMNPETKLDAKTKELIGLAVAAQIPCEYCIQFHTEAAKQNGASDQEVQEAVGMAAVTREMSTLLNGNQVDKVQFKKDLDRIMHNKQQAKR